MSELEVDKWLHPGTLELHDNKDRNRQHHRLNKQRRTGNDCLQTVFRRQAFSEVYYTSKFLKSY